LIVEKATCTEEKEKALAGAVIERRHTIGLPRLSQENPVGGKGGEAGRGSRSKNMARGGRETVALKTSSSERR